MHGYKQGFPALICDFEGGKTLRKSAAIVFLTLASAASAESVAESYEALFESAVRAVTWDLADNWAYTETRTGTEGTFVSRYETMMIWAARSCSA